MVRLTLTLLCFVASAYAQLTGSSSAPFYSAATIVQAATQTVEALAPNTIGTIYGTNLAFDTRAVATSDLIAGTLPTSLNGVTVMVGSIPANLFYISPTQINFLVPYSLTAGTVPIWVARQGLAGPIIPVQLNATAPAFFQWSGNLAVASHLNGSLVSQTAPASAGEIVVIYAAGLGRVTPDTTSGKVTPFAATVIALSQMSILLAGTPVPPANVLYAGLAPGFAGLYQINLLIPLNTPPNPEIRVGIGAQVSPPAIQLALQ